MAQKIQTTMVCDLTHKFGKEAEAISTATFSWDGTAYELDVCAEHETKLQDAFGTYMTHGRKVSGKRQSHKRPAGNVGPVGPSGAEVREWIKTQRPDLIVSNRGRVPAEIMKVYADAH